MNFVFTWMLGATAIMIHYLDYYTTYWGLTKCNQSVYEGNPLGRWVMKRLGLKTAIISMKLLSGFVPVMVLWLVAPQVVGFALLVINFVGALAVVNNRKLLGEAKTLK